MKDDSPLKAVGGFLLSLLLVGIVAYVLGRVFGGELVAQSGAWGDLENVVSLFTVVPIATLLFAVAAWPTKDWVLAIYPFVAFTISGGLQDTAAASWLASTLPIPPQTYSNYAYDVAAVFLSYVVVHSIAWPLNGVFKARGEYEGWDRTLVLSNVGIIACVVAVIIAAPSWVPPISETEASVPIQRTGLPEQLPANMVRDANGYVQVVGEDGGPPSYEAVGWFKFPEGNIKFPVTEDLRGMYVSDDASDPGKGATLSTDRLGEAECVHDHELIFVIPVEGTGDGTDFTLEMASGDSPCGSPDAFFRRVELKSQISWANSNMRKID